jgi:aspartate aminotransferase-like enzyme
MSGQMIDHRGPEFSDIFKRVSERLKSYFQTTNEVLILTSSGTGAMEAAVVNTLSPGEKVLAVSIGSFGDRFASIASRYGANVTKMDVEWGKAADPAKIREALQADPDITTVLVTHNETSTGITNPLKEIAAAIKSEGRLILVDAVSSLGSLPLAMDDWGLDVVCTGSQKGWMVPPGLAMIALSDAAWQAQQRATMPRFYFDLGEALEYARRGQTPATPAVSLLYALDVSLNALDREGLEGIYARQARRRTRDGVRALGLSLLAEEQYASDTVTAVLVPEGINASEWLKKLRGEHNTVLATGQGKLNGKIVRIGHLGMVSEQDIDNVLTAMATTLKELGFAPAAAGAR